MSDIAGLGRQLRVWRGRVQPSDVGSPFDTGARKTPGLRREEVAWLAGVSPDYVKRLEQGRAHPSADVVRALARALRISDVEYELACHLAGYADNAHGVVPRRITPSVCRLMDRLGDSPIAVFDATWSRLDQNELWTAVTGDQRGLRGWTANVAWRVFVGDPGRIRQPAPDEHKRSLVADLREVVLRYPRDRDLQAMITTLRAKSPEFEELWHQPTVSRHGNERKTIQHPRVGEIEVDCDVLSVYGVDLRVVVFTAAPRTTAAEKLRLLAVLASEDMTAAFEPARQA